ncbi:C6 zinc finger domain protein [Fusarium subglutinans]|uniref:C6 zinc finger domain protein n=1 Tax=Gibberella subglutinans TaxID=42677 RepID=A0A8H5PSQ1_GIBSU|nr:C6 zinc finger domain protein [Fusarium subglutinans]KAF5601521.1 C6 zinc finger domain protein [Fusarium subglutinans]
MPLTPKIPRHPLPQPSPPLLLSAKAPKAQRTNSHHGCLECRVKRVKCDEAFPVCRRCQRRGSVCMASTRPAQWQIEMPWLSNMTVFDSWPGDGLPNKSPTPSAILGHGLVDSKFDDKIEQRLLVWSSNRGGKHIQNLSNAYRNHGLLMLYQTRRQTHLQSEKLMPLSPPTAQSEHESNQKQREWLPNILFLALEAIENLLEIPLTKPCANFQSLPLLSAAAELTSNENDWRSKSISQFRMLYSINRVPVQVWSIQLLQEIWALKDSGGSVSWLELSLAKGWKLRFS